MLKTIIGFTALALLVSGCGSSGGSEVGTDGTDEKQSSAVLRVTTDEYSFTLDPSSVRRGKVDVVLKNEGTEVHQALFYKLNDGVSYKEFEDVVIHDDSSIPEFAALVSGGIRSVGAEGSERAFARLEEPGDYAVVCFLPDQTTLTEKEHNEFGMIAPLTVE